MRDATFRVLTLLLLIVRLPLSLAAQAPPVDRSADIQAIRTQIERICQAFVDKDRAVLEHTHDADWRGFTPFSDHVIRGLNGYMNEATFDPRTPKGQGMVGYRLSDFDVVFFGDTAVASFVLETDVRIGTDTTTQKLTLLDVFNRQSSGWIQVASNTSLHPDELDRRMSRVRDLNDRERGALLEAREAVWRAWFAGDTTALSKRVPPELVTIDGESASFGTLASNLDAAASFAAAGGKLTRLTFPRTEIQAYGMTAILYTTYDFDLTVAGKTETQHGAATEIFVQRNGAWINTGWQLSPVTGPFTK
jgi:uncharacterized protein DUF4440